ncbi:MAG TPA: hypothetical protein VEL12_08155 [Candidatus Nitrosopolaris sp.]|nr:hypothetical protein [Candidatus Nitrosopolaris sp.]
MDTTSWVIVGVIAGLLIIALLAVSRRSRQLPRANLMPLTPEARDRYVVRWDQVESRFVEAPAEAVREADALVLALLGEREHPLAEKRLPEGVRKARREGARGGTESLRVAMLHYRAVIEEMARIPEAERMREGRRETA